MTTDKFLSEKIKKIDEYTPIETVARIRLDANESPFTPSAALTAKFAELLKDTELNRYPDPYTKNLINRFADVYKLQPKNIVAGNGSDELISIIFNSFLSRGDKVLCLLPDFSMYVFYGGLIEAEVIPYEKQDGRDIDFDELTDIIRANDVKLAILSNPCNPNGYAYDRQTILNFVRNSTCLTVIDEAYMDFCERDCSILADYNDYPNLLILKTLSKIGFAALRVGFAIGNETLIRGIKKVKSPYNVNSLSQIYAALMLENFGEVRANIQRIIKTRAVLYSFLAENETRGGYKTIPSDANFVSVVFSEADRAERIYSDLQEIGISVRYMKSQKRLRITVGTESETDEFISALKKEYKRLL
jgi:histidinol-phosphate aminotransferase